MRPLGVVEAHPVVDDPLGHKAVCQLKQVDRTDRLLRREDPGLQRTPVLLFDNSTIDTADGYRILHRYATVDMLSVMQRNVVPFCVGGGCVRSLRFAKRTRLGFRFQFALRGLKNDFCKGFGDGNDRCP